MRRQGASREVEKKMANLTKLLETKADYLPPPEYIVMVTSYPTQPENTTSFPMKRSSVAHYEWSCRYLCFMIYITPHTQMLANVKYVQ